MNEQYPQAQSIRGVTQINPRDIREALQAIPDGILVNVEVSSRLRDVTPVVECHPHGLQLLPLTLGV